MDRYPAEHIPVMAEEIVAHLNIKPEGIYVDATLGLGGHARKILAHLGPRGRLIGFDQDLEALARAKDRLSGFDARCEFVHSNFRYLNRQLKELKVDGVDGFVFDLGVSSLQLNSAQRGFSFQSDGPLDMRMDPQQGRSAADLVAEVPEKELADIIFKYGEDRFARRIAHYIARERQLQPILTTAGLSRIICRAIPSGRKWQKVHPATRTFQALRIAVNDELGSLEEGLGQALEMLRPGGRVCVIAFHSLEDRFVKTTFKRLAGTGEFQLPFKKPLRPGPEEENDNPRSRSARLRVVERL